MAPRKDRDVAGPVQGRDGSIEMPGVSSTAVSVLSCFGRSRSAICLTPDLAAYLTPVVSFLTSRTWTGPATSRPFLGATTSCHQHLTYNPPRCQGNVSPPRALRYSQGRDARRRHPCPSAGATRLTIATSRRWPPQPRSKRSCRAFSGATAGASSGESANTRPSSRCELSTSRERRDGGLRHRNHDGGSGTSAFSDSPVTRTVDTPASSHQLPIRARRAPPVRGKGPSPT